MTVRESDTYRRGLTLGLTMAEIFILLLFLLLLVLLALYAVNFEQEKELQSATEDIEKTQIELDAAVKKVKELEKTQLPEDIVHNRKLQNENKHLAGALDAANTKSEEQQLTIDELSAQLAKAIEENQSLADALGATNTESGRTKKRHRRTPCSISQSKGH